MTKLLLALLSASVLGAGGLAAAAGLGDVEPARVLSLPAATTGTTTTDKTEAEDISGPCDEAEHRNDPRCTGTSTTTARGDDDGVAEDLSGPCDEAEHRNDQHCTGAEPNDADRSEPGSGSDDRDNDHDDRSGSNSGKG